MYSCSLVREPSPCEIHAILVNITVSNVPTDKASHVHLSVFINSVALFGLARSHALHLVATRVTTRIYLLVIDGLGSGPALFVDLSPWISLQEVDLCLLVQESKVLIVGR